MPSPGAALPAGDEVGVFETAEGCWQRLPLDRAELDESQPFPVGALVPCPGIRPGARVWSEGSGCTLNFVFRGTSYDEEGKPVDEGLFIGLAGHCVLGGHAEKTWTAGTGPVATDAARERFGQVEYAVLGFEDDTHLDWALIRVDDDREPEVKPGLCHFGGPSGMSDTWNEGDLVHHFGQGLVYENTVQGRSGVVLSGETISVSSIVFAGATQLGDSGSPLIQADGDAVGLVVAGLSPLAFATPIATQVEMAEEQLDMDLALVEAPLA